MIQTDHVVCARFEVERYIAQHPENASIHSGELVFYYVYGDPFIAEVASQLIALSPHKEHMMQVLALIRNVEIVYANNNWYYADSLARYLCDNFLPKFDPALGCCDLTEQEQLNLTYMLCGCSDLVLTSQQLRELSPQERDGYELARCFRAPILLELGINCYDRFVASMQSFWSTLHAGYESSESPLHRIAFEIKLSRDHEQNRFQTRTRILDCAALIKHSPEPVPAAVAMDWAAALTTPLESMETYACDLKTLSERVAYQVECLRVNQQLPIIFDLSSIREPLLTFGMPDGKHLAFLNEQKGPEMRRARLSELGAHANEVTEQNLWDCLSIVAAQSTSVLKPYLAPTMRNVAFDGWISVKPHDDSKVTHVFVEGGVVTKGPPNLKGTELPHAGESDDHSEKGGSKPSSKQSSKPSAKPSNSAKSKTQAKANTSKEPKGKKKTWTSVFIKPDFKAYPYAEPSYTPEQKAGMELYVRKRLAQNPLQDVYVSANAIINHLDNIAPRTNFGEPL